MADDLVARIDYIEANIGELDIPDVEWLIAQLRAVVAERDAGREEIDRRETDRHFQVLAKAELQAQLADVTTERDMGLRHRQAQDKWLAESIARERDLQAHLTASEAALREVQAHLPKGAPLYLRALGRVAGESEA